MKIEAIVVAEVSEREVQLSKTNGGLEICLPTSLHTNMVILRLMRNDLDTAKVIDEQVAENLS